MVDTRPALGLRVIAVLVASDFVVCPIEREKYSLNVQTLA